MTHKHNISAILIMVVLNTMSHILQFQGLSLVNAPVTTNKHDDEFFFSETLGWLVTRDGKIIKTTDGGDSWQEKVTYPGVRLRCIGFADSLRGRDGTLRINPSTKFALLQTKDIQTRKMTLVK